MTRIRVDTEELKRSAKEIASAADSIGKAGDEILSVAMSMPSYDGQLSGPARKAGYEIQSQHRDLDRCFRDDATYVVKAAEDFEGVDHRTVQDLDQSRKDIGDYLREILEGAQKIYDGFSEMVDGITKLGEYIIQQVIITGVGIVKLTAEEIIKTIHDELIGHDRGGNALMGYDYDPKTGVLIVWQGKDVRVYYLDPNAPMPVKFDKFMESVDSLDDAKLTMLLGLLGALGSTGAFLFGLLDPEPISKIGLIGAGMLGLGISVLTIGFSAINMIDKAIDCQTYWEALDSNPSPSTNPASNPSAVPSTSP
jgi:hypothetical protein